MTIDKVWNKWDPEFTNWTSANKYILKTGDVTSKVLSSNSYTMPLNTLNKTDQVWVKSLVKE